ncbi:MAG: Antibiotic transport system permease protein [Parcubacteria group bacterium GW2011_GWA2_44_13]|nr:MAG: Antibiotic transport system permease protein [Parcubacteria group bacterium GW2011_GWA2_44_13]
MNTIGLYALIEYEVSKLWRVWIQILVTPWISALLYILIFGQIIRRFVKNIEELLAAPLSYMEMVAGFVTGGIIRGLVVAAGVYAVAFLFTATSVAHIFLFIFYSVSVALIFSLLGLLIGLWSENFEQLAIPQTFVIMPLTFLGGLFNSIHMLPEKFQWFVKINPFFYFVDGLRYSMIGISESNRTLGFVLIFALVFGLGFLVWYLFKKGYKIRT